MSHEQPINPEVARIHEMMREAGIQIDSEVIYETTREHAIPLRGILKELHDDEGYLITSAPHVKRVRVEYKNITSMKLASGDSLNS